VIDGLTGATITSTAVRDIVNRTIEDGPRLIEPAAPRTLQPLP
jgi:hypothetical protein